MSQEKKALGRGLNALFGDEENGSLDQQASQTDYKNDVKSDRRMIDIAQISPGKFQPRHSFDEKTIEELSQSIQKHGLIQPILVRQVNGSSYEIIAGERRWRAAQKALLHQVPVIIREIDDQTSLEIGLIENLQREDLNPIDESRALKKLMELFGYSQEEVAEKVGKSRPYVSNMLRLADLPSEISVLVEKGELSAGHARTLIGLPAAMQEMLARKFISAHLNVRQAEKLANDAKSNNAKKPKNTSTPQETSRKDKDINTLSLEKEIANVLGMSVVIDMTDSQAGSLNIHFRNLDQLDEVLHRLSHNPGRLAIRS